MSVEIVGVTYYNQTTDVYEAEPPSITEGQTSSIAVEVKNDTPLERDVTVEAAITAPDGVVSPASSTKAIAAGALDNFYFSFTAEQSGQYFASVLAILGIKNFTNLLTNGEFEIGDPPTGWLTEGVPVTISREDTIVKSGSHSLKVVAGVECNAYQLLAAFAGHLGHELTSGGWVYATEPSSCMLSVRDSVGTTYADLHTGGSVWEWQRVTRLINPAAAWVWGGVVHGYAGKTFYVDGLWVCEGDCCPGPIDSFGPGLVVTVSPTIIQQIIPIIGIVAGLALIIPVVKGLFKK